MILFLCYNIFFFFESLYFNLTETRLEIRSNIGVQKGSRLSAYIQDGSHNHFQHYIDVMFEGFQEGPQFSSHDAERR